MLYAPLKPSTNKNHKSMKKLWFSLLLACGLARAEALPEGTWIDVRTTEEYQAGHLENAQNIPFDEIKDKIQALNLDKDAPIHLYCKSGRRAEVALNQLKELGYTNVQNHGGYDDLKDAQKNN